MIEITRLTKQFGRHNIIEDISFNAQRGEILGILGLANCGKSTIIKLLCGVTAPSSGTVKIFGFDIPTHITKAQRQIGYLPESLCSYPDTQVNSFLNFIANIRQLRGIAKSSRLDQLTKQLEIEHLMNHPISTLTRIEKKKIGLAQALLHEPDLLLLDAPMSGLSPDQKIHFQSLIKSLATNKVVVMTSHNPEDLSGICSRILVLSNGRLLIDDSPTELERKSRHYQAVTLAASHPLDLLALAVLPGVAGIEKAPSIPGAITVLAMPGQAIFPHINALISERRWDVNTLLIDRGRVDDAFHNLIRDQPH